jgi:hypothetical protein
LGVEACARTGRQSDGIRVDFAVVGLLVCPTALLILALLMRISRRSAVIGGALFAASLLLFEPHIQ